MRVRTGEPIIVVVSEDRSYHRIADELRPDWLQEWAAGGIEEIEAYLAKHAAFLTYLGEE